MDGDLKLALLADPIAEMEAAIASRNGSMSTQSMTQKFESVAPNGMVRRR
jgi:hypothetical protein